MAHLSRNVACALALSLILAVTAGCGGGDKAGSAPAGGGKGSGPAQGSDAPRFASVDRGEIARIINASGKVRPVTLVQVGSEVSGRLVTINVDFNSEVKAGDLLAVIDPETFRNRVEEARASLEAARSQIAIREAALNQAEVTRAQAATERDRARALANENAISASRLETVERDFAVADSQVRSASAQLAAARSALRQSEVALQTAQINLARTEIRSPIDGVITQRKVDVGQTVQASFSAPELFQIADDLSRIQLEANIVESDVASLDAGDEVSFTVDAYPTERFTGTVTQLRLQPSVQQNIVIYTAIVEAPNEARRLLPGMTANMQITTERRPDVLRVPAAVERFRPSPEQVAAWEAAAGGPFTEDLLGWEETASRLTAIGVPPERQSAIKTELETATQALRDAIADPTQGFNRTPNLQRLNGQKRLVIAGALNPTELQALAQIVQAARASRSVQVWVKGTDGLVRPRDVAFGLSDGSFVEVSAGLQEGDSVVAGFGAPGQGAGPRGPGGPGRRPGGGRG